jgi:KUP system potassium uptake protein
VTAIMRDGTPIENRGAWAPAALACMGIVFGDIGTSPLYTLQIATKAASPNGAISPEAVIGIVSLIFWSLIIVISIKYALLIMRASNHGEGGILALLALVSPHRAKNSRQRAVMVVVGLIGATLLYGDGTITPAISVLSAIEGIKVYAPQTERFVVPLTLVILVVLFVIQRKGTSWIGGIFGPIMLIWFVVIGILGIVGIAKAPAILAALSPLPAITYLWHAGPLALAVIGGAFLAVTGGEAFYADMGHFGPLPIRIAWFGVALPALTLNYFGQWGLLLTEPGAVENSFYQRSMNSVDFSRISRRTLSMVSWPWMARWRKAIFAFMHHNAQRPGAYFNIPSAQVMEIGIEFEIGAHGLLPRVAFLATDPNRMRFDCIPGLTPSLRRARRVVGLRRSLADVGRC